VLVLMATLLVLGVLVVGLTLWSGGSLRGGMGNGTAVPANAALVGGEYQWGVGNFWLNLSGVQFPTKGQTVHANVGIGNLTVDLPKDTLVNLQAKSGLGSVDVFGGTGTDIEGTYRNGEGPVKHRLTLDAHVGVGHIDVSWAGQ
jgi:hypothetical protein